MAVPPIPAGWPCALLSSPPPSVADRQTAPTADELLPQILALGPRGPAWGTDEAGDGRGASPMLRRFWRGVAGWLADINTRDSEVAAQAFPSAITLALADWEAELGLPDPCMPVGRSVPQRIATVRARFGAQGGASPAYYTCVAASLGYAVTIEEPTQFRVSVSECVAFQETVSVFRCGDSRVGKDGDRLEAYAFPASAAAGDEVAGGKVSESYFRCGDSQCGEQGNPLFMQSPPDPNASTWKYWVMHVDTTPNTYFRCGDSVVGAAGDRLEGYSPALDLECEVGRLSPPHTALVVQYPD